MSLWTPDNSSVPPSKGHKANRAEASKRTGLRQGTLGCKGGGRRLMQEPDHFVSAKAAGCRHYGTDRVKAEHWLRSRYEKFDLPPVRPEMTRVECYASNNSCSGGTTLALVPDVTQRSRGV